MYFDFVCFSVKLKMLIFFGIQVDEEQSEIIKCLIHGVKQKEKYPESVRKFSLTLHYHSPRAYEFCRKTFNNHLPHAHQSPPGMRILI